MGAGGHDADTSNATLFFGPSPSAMDTQTDQSTEMVRGAAGQETDTPNTALFFEPSLPAVDTHTD